MDYIPADDDEFNTYVTEQFVPFATANAAQLNLSAGDVTELTTAKTDWTDTWTAFQNAKHAYEALVLEKNATRAAMEAVIRKDANKIQADPSVTNVAKQGLGITVRKTTRDPVPRPETVPALARIDTSTRAILRLFIVDSTTPESRAKPPGVKGCEIREQVGGTAPTDPEAMTFLAIETRPPYRADFDAADVGKTVYFALRWMNNRGETGPWSQIFSAVIPS